MIIFTYYLSKYRVHNLFMIRNILVIIAVLKYQQNLQLFELKVDRTLLTIVAVNIPCMILITYTHTQDNMDEMVMNTSCYSNSSFNNNGNYNNFNLNLIGLMINAIDHS